MKRLKPRDVFDQHVNLVYGICWKWVVKLLSERGRHKDREQLDELVQDACARAYAGFLKRCQRSLPKVEQRRNWIAQSAFYASKNVLSAKRAFGNPAPVPGYVDAMTRRGSTRALGIHGTDDERELPYQEQLQEPTVAELQACVDKQGFPEKLHKVAQLAALEVSQKDIATLLGCSLRTVEYRLRAIKDWLNANEVTVNTYAVVADALTVA